MQKIKTLVITGCSTGGYATFTYSNFINDFFRKINKTIQVLAIPEAGFFPDYYNFKTNDRRYYLTNKIFYEVTIENEEPKVLTPECYNEFPAEEDKCVLTENYFKHIRVPLLLLQSSYDSSNISEDLGISCVDNGSLNQCNEEEKLNSQVYKVYQNELIHRAIGTNPNVSAWLISRVTHCLDNKDSLDWAIPGGSENIINRVVQKFIKNPFQKHI